MSRIAFPMLLASGFFGSPVRPADEAVKDVSKEEPSRDVAPSPRSGKATLSLATRVMEAAAIIANSGSESASGSLPETRVTFRETSGKITGSFSLELSADSIEEILEGLAQAGAAVPELRIEALRLSTGRHDDFDASVNATVAEAPSSPSGVPVRAARAIERAWRRAGLRLERLQVKHAGPIWKLSGSARTDGHAADPESWKTPVTAAATVFEEVAIDSIRISEVRFKDGGKKRVLVFVIRAAKPRSPSPEGEEEGPTEREEKE